MKNQSIDHSKQKNNEAKHPVGLRTLIDLFDISPAVAAAVLIFSGLVVVLSIFFFIRSAPPTSLTITTGPEGSVYQKNALKYAKILEKNGVKLKVLTSNGSIENLDRLVNPAAHVDIGIVQAGITGVSTENLVSLASISYQPLMLFYRGKHQDLVSAFTGKKVAVGPIGSGSRNFALALLAANGIKEGGATELLDWESDEAAKALMERKIDAAFIMSESASTDILHNLLRSKEVELFDFKQANAYSRKIDFLNVLELPQGSVELGLNIPPHDVALLGPMVELVANKNLHPALADLLLEAAVEVHSRAGTFQRRGEFPTALEHAIPLSEDAVRFFKSGKSFLYRYLPFWLASLLSRIIVVFIPTLVLLIPAVKSIPMFFRWRIQNKIHRRYRDLLQLEKDFVVETNSVQLEKMRKEFDKIEATVNKMKIPAAFADQFYGLRGHIDYVRDILSKRLA